MDWYDITDKYHGLTLTQDGELDSLSEEWQRELAALWRLEADVNNGGYLQFFVNWGASTNAYAIVALQKIGATKMHKLISESYATLSNATDTDRLTPAQMLSLMPNPMIGKDGGMIKEAGSPLPPLVLEKLDDLSYQFMGYPEDLPELGLAYYQPFLDGK